MRERGGGESERGGRMRETQIERDRERGGGGRERERERQRQRETDRQTERQTETERMTEGGRERERERERERGWEGLCVTEDLHPVYSTHTSQAHLTWPFPTHLNAKVLRGHQP